jgi:DNA-binding MarR family transcriptional regulator
MAHVSDNSAWLEPGNCISYRLRRAARMTAKKFDDALRPLGIRNTQFTLLAAVNEMGPISIGALSEALATDSTTLNRNLEILSLRAFVEDAPMEDGAVKDGRVRAIDLTGDGRAIYKHALPIWRATQTELLDAMQGDRWGEMILELAEIEKASRPSL